MSQTRRLAAILAADVAGYSRLIGGDEGGTLRRLRAIRDELVDPPQDVPDIDHDGTAPTEFRLCLPIIPTERSTDGDRRAK